MRKKPKLPFYSEFDERFEDSDRSIMWGIVGVIALACAFYFGFTHIKH